MGSLTGLPSKEVRTPISHEVEPHNRPFDRKHLPVAEKGRILSDEERQQRWAAEFEKAFDELQTLNPAEARDLMVRVPPYQLECYLIAEELGQGREQLLRFFPKPGARARERFTPQVVESFTPAVKEAPPVKRAARKPRAKKKTPTRSGRNVSDAKAPEAGAETPPQVESETTVAIAAEADGETQT